MNEIPEQQRILSKKICVKRRGLHNYARLHLPGESAYDYTTVISAEKKRPVISASHSCESLEGTVLFYINLMIQDFINAGY